MAASSHRARGTVGIKDIAKALGVSIGTVDRALHGRPGINPVTRARVLNMAKQMGYRPNLAARYLKSRKQMRLSVQLPAEIASFFDPVREGIQRAAAPFEPAVAVEFETYPRLGQGDLEAFQEALEEKPAGIIICPADPAEFRPWIRKAAQANIPVVCVASDAPSTERLTAVSADPYVGGSVVAELFTRFLRRPGRIAVVTGDLSTVDHAEKLRGFLNTLEELGEGLAAGPVIEAHDDEDEAYRQTVKLLKQRGKNLLGVYVATANSLPVLRAMEEKGSAEGLTIITTDLFPELAALIRSAKVAATMYQRPLSQGRLAFQALYQFLVEGVCPPPRIKLAPHVVMRSNLNLFLEKMPSEAELENESETEPATA